MRHLFLAFFSLYATSLAATTGSQSHSTALETIHLKDSSRLTGSLTTLKQDSTASLVSSATHSPLEIFASSIAKIDFPKLNSHAGIFSEHIFLRNGDSMPCTVSQIDADTISFSSDGNTSFQLPRSQVHKIQFNDDLDSLIYLGPKKSDAWSTDSHWTFKDHTLTCLGKGVAALPLETPDNFTLECRLHWETKQPQFTLQLCADKNQVFTECYFFEFSSHALQIGRTYKNQSRTLFDDIDYALRNIADQTVDLKLHVDRTSRTLTLYLNNKKIGTFDDNMLKTPTGKFLRISTPNVKASDTLSISNIRVYKGSSDKLSLRKLPLGKQQKHDVFYDAEGLKFSGKIISYSAEKKALAFKAESMSQTLIAPRDKVTAILFAKSAEDTTSKDTSNSAFVLELLTGGKLHVNALTLDATTLHASHPALGDIALLRSNLLSITSTTSENAQ